MNITDVMTIINTVGFPIACVLGLAFFIYKNTQAQREERQQINDTLLQFALNIQANTQALNNLSELIKENKKNDEE